MLNQSNNYFNYVLTYFDQGGNNIWWSANKASNLTPIAELLITGEGIDPACIEPGCNPICSNIIESETQSIETLADKQFLIYPIFTFNKDSINIKLNNLKLQNQPNYIESDCINEECIEEFGIWTKAINSNTKVEIEDETYYFIKANPDSYGFGYLYRLSLIHEETGEEIFITKEKGLMSQDISFEQSIPEGFNACLYIIKFDIEQRITTYKFINNPLFLRSDWNNNLKWEPQTNNTEEILFSIIYLLSTNEEINNKDELTLYKNNQQYLTNLLIKTISSITKDNSLEHSYIKNSTYLFETNNLITNDNKDLLSINPGIYNTSVYSPSGDNNLIYILILFAIAKINTNFEYISLLNEYIIKCIKITPISLKEEVLKIIALTEAYKQTKDIYYLSIVTTSIQQVERLYKLENGDYIESLANPIYTVESKVYGDILEFYINNRKPNVKDYILEEITYINDISDILYLLDQQITLINNPLDLLILRLIGINIPYINISNNKLIYDVLNLKLTNILDSSLLESYELYKTKLFLDYRNSIPTDFKWLSDVTPIQDLIINGTIKPLIDLYIHAKYIKDSYIEKDAVTNKFTNKLVSNIKDLLSKTITTDLSLQNTLWPGKYSNSIDLEIKGYYNKTILNEVNTNIKTLGIETNLISALDLPNQSNFNLCFSIVKLEDFRCQVDINGQLILLSDGQCNLAPPELPILLQENTGPITQESSRNDYILI